MRIERFALGLLAALLLVSSGGCKKSSSDTPPPTINSNRLSTINSPAARLHWLGMNRIAAETNAARFLSLWNLPESTRLENQTLTKLALALTGEPPSLVTNQITITFPVTNATTGKPVTAPAQTIDYQLSTINQPLSTKLRPLLDDLVRQEWYLEIQQAGARLSPAAAGSDNPGTPANTQHSGRTDAAAAEDSRAPVELALAIRLDATRSSLWTSNLIAVLASLPNVQSLPPIENPKSNIQNPESLPATANALAWRLPPIENQKSQIKNPSPPFRLDLARVGDWTLVGLAPETLNPQPSTLNALAARIQRAQTPVAGTPSDSAPTLQRSNAPPPPPDTNPPVWLEADLDLPRLLTTLHAPRSTLQRFNASTLHASRFYLTAQADEVGVRTRAKLDFPEPLPLELEPWNIPTNLIHDPLIGFGAVRSLRPLLLSTINNQLPQLSTNYLSSFILHPSSFPNQSFFWAQNIAGGLHFLAFPSQDASNQLVKLSDLLLRDLSPILATNGWLGVELARRTNSPGVVLQGNPFFSPNLGYADCGANRFLFMGFSTHINTNSPPPPGLFHYLQSNPKLVAYDWERTRYCLDDWTQIAQLSRHMLCLPRMNAPDNAGLAWVVALALKIPDGPTVTSVELSSPTRLSFARTSPLGFTGVEMEVLADWLESLQFPRGLHTFTAPPPPPVK